MPKKSFWTFALALLAFCLVVLFAGSESVHSQRPQPRPEDLARRRDIEAQLQSIAIVERKMMIPMSDGTRIATDVYRPKDTSKKYPTIFVRTPYNFNYWDVRNGAPRDLLSELEAVKRGYAFVQMNERAQYATLLGEQPSLEADRVLDVLIDVWLRAIYGAAESPKP